MWRQCPANETDPSPQGHDGGQDVVATAPLERALIELVDLALDLLGEQEVTIEDFVHERREQVTGSQLPEARLAETVPETSQGGRLAVVDRQDDVGRRDQFDLAEDQATRVSGVGLEGLHRQMQAVVGSRKASPSNLGVVGRASVELDAEHVEHGGKRVLGVTCGPVDVHPEQALRPE
jgi:hypothetical protein